MSLADGGVAPDAGAPGTADGAEVAAGATEPAEITPGATPTSPETPEALAAPDTGAQDARAVERALARRARARTLAREHAEQSARLERSVSVDDLRKDPLGAFKRAGLEVEDFAHHVISGKAREPSVEERLAAYEKRDADREAKREADERHSRNSTAITGAKKNLVGFARGNEAKYPFLCAHKDEVIGDSLFAAANTFFEKRGRAPTMEEIAKAVEKEAYEKFKEVNDNYTRITAPRTPAVAPKPIADENGGLDLESLSLEERVAGLKSGKIKI